MFRSTRESDRSDSSEVSGDVYSHFESSDNRPFGPVGPIVTFRTFRSMWHSDWTVRAACRSADPDELFVQGAAQNRAKAVCSGCPVRTECLADALDHRVEFGVWGGMTERERRALLRRRPHVTSWRRLLESARDEYELNSIDCRLGA